MNTKNDNAKIIEPYVKTIGGRKTIIDRAYLLDGRPQTFSELSNKEFIKIIGGKNEQRRVNS